LEEAGAKLDATIDFEDLVNNPQGLKVIEATLEMRIPEGNGSNSKPRKRQFTVEALTSDLRRKEVRLKMVVRTSREGVADEIYSVFWPAFLIFRWWIMSGSPTATAALLFCAVFNRQARKLLWSIFPPHGPA
jgi:hypothetical protein